MTLLIINGCYTHTANTATQISITGKPEKGVEGLGCANYSKEYIDVFISPYLRKLFKGANCSRGYNIQGNTVFEFGVTRKTHFSGA